MAPLRQSVLAAALAALLVVLVACGDDDDDEDALALPAGTCGKLEYKGQGEPQALIVSDLPMRGASAERSKQQVEAIRLVLERNGWRAGGTAVAFQSCDDSIAKTGLWDAKTCRANAAAYAKHEQLLGVIGTYNSGCASEMIPTLSRAGVAMISPGNTAVCLTQASAACENGQPDSLYNRGKRNYARVVPNDAFQGAGLAEFAREKRLRRIALLYAKDDPTSLGQAGNFRGAAEQLGLKIVAYKPWDPSAKSYGALMRRVKQGGPDALVLAGLIEQNGARLIRDKAGVVGSNENVPLIAFDGFAQQATIDKAGAGAAGMFASVPGRSPEQLSGAGRDFVRELEGRLGGKPVELYAPYAGEAVAVLLKAIGEAGPSRTATVDAIFATRMKGGILGSYSFTTSGDPSVGPVTIFLARRTLAPQKVITPESGPVRAARLGR